MKSLLEVEGHYDFEKLDPAHRLAALRIVANVAPVLFSDQLSFAQQLEAVIVAAADQCTKDMPERETTRIFLEMQGQLKTTCERFKQQLGRRGALLGANLAEADCLPLSTTVQ